MPFDDLARVPFFIAGAGVAGGRRTGDLAQNHDVVPTCLELAGLRHPVAGELDSRSLLPYFEAGGAGADRVVYCSSQDDYPMVRRGTLKYFRHLASGEEMLFDLANDPGETANLAADANHSAALRQLREDLDRVLNEGVAELPTAPPRA
jgi:choline-sulfatase